MPKSAFKRILEALTNNLSSSSIVATEKGFGTNEELDDLFSENNFHPCKTARHGFPNKPSVLAFDSVQELLAIGCKSGSIRIFGQEGVDCYLSHDVQSPVIQLIFLSGQGALLSVCGDGTIHLWNLRQKRPGILHSLNYTKDSITFCHVSHQSDWIYIGTNKGNTNICNLETFTLSGYAINWNKAVELSQKNHPGGVVSICENPIDENKVLISFETGLSVLWNLKSQATEQRYRHDCEISSTCWHSNGRQFICGLQNGSLVTWDSKKSQPISQDFPHAKDQKTSFSSVTKVQWLSNRNANDFIIFTGGLPVEKSSPSVTVMKGRSIITLEVSHPVMDFIALPSTPWQCDFQDPKELAILTESEIILADLESTGYPLIEFGHPMDIHDSPVTCLKFIPDPNTDLIPGLYQVSARKSSRSDISKKDWPIGGGEWSKHECDGVPEVIVTGHADGSVKFWDASAVSLKFIYKLRTKKLFKKEDPQNPIDEDPYQITHVSLCPESRTLVLVNRSSVVMILKFSSEENPKQIETLMIPGVHETLKPSDLLASNGDLSQINQNGTSESLPQADPKLMESDNSGGNTERKKSIDNRFRNSILKIKSGSIRQAPGFQTQLMCFLSENDPNPCTNVTYLTMNTSYQLLAFGTSISICVIDMLQKTCLFNICTVVVLKSIDKRINLKSPGLVKTLSNDSSQTVFSFDTNTLKPADEVNGSNGKPSDAKTKWKAVTKKSRNATKSIGDIFNPSRSILSFRRSSLLPKSPISVFPPDLSKHRSETCSDLLSASTPEIVYSDPVPSPSAPIEENQAEAFDFSDEVTQSSKIKFVMSDDDDGNTKKTDPDLGLRPDSVLSRSSAASDTEHLCASEVVSFLSFANNYTKQSEKLSLPCLWVGTSSGYLFSYIVHLPNNAESRSTQPVILSPSGSLLQAKGGIVHCNFLDSSGHLMSAGAGNWRDHTCPGTITVTSSPDSSDGEHSSQSAIDKQFMVVCSEQQAKIFTLPSQACIQIVKFNVATTGHVTNAVVDVLSNGTCLACTTTEGYILVYNIPSLNPLLETPHLPSNDPRVLHTFSFGVDGHAVYMATPSEMQRITYSLDTFGEIQDVAGHLFVPRKAPELPSIGFLNGLFGGGYNAIDRRELFGQSRASRGVAQHIPGSGHSSLEGLRGSSGSFVNDIRKLQAQVVERGEKLSQVDEKTAEMNETANKLASTGNSLAAKYRNKKWYQV